MDNLDIAVYRTAHDHCGGIPALAKRIDARAGTLQNKCDPAMDGHKLNIYEARAMMPATGDVKILKALADDLGFICIPAGDRSRTCDMDLLTAYTRLDKERGDVGKRIHEALDDGRLTRKEVKRVQAGKRERKSRRCMNCWCAWRRSRSDGRLPIPSGRRSVPVVDRRRFRGVERGYFVYQTSITASIFFGIGCGNEVGINGVAVGYKKSITLKKNDKK